MLSDNINSLYITGVVLYLGLLYVIQKDLWSKAWNVNEFKFGRSANGPPSQSSIDALNTATPILADLPMDPPVNRA